MISHVSVAIEITVKNNDYMSLEQIPVLNVSRLYLMLSVILRNKPKCIALWLSIIKEVIGYPKVDVEGSFEALS